VECVNLKGFLRRATPYEHWPAPLNPTLRDAVVFSRVSIIVMVAILLIRPSWLPFANWAFARLPGSHSFLLALNLFSALVYIVLWFRTKGLRSGRALWHKVAFAETVIGAMNGFIVSLTLAIWLPGPILPLVQEVLNVAQKILVLVRG
jgi:hypothetical protein